jgi:hypothetical protein
MAGKTRERVRLVFPTGTDDGRPFSSLAHACSWLEDAAAGTFGPTSYVPNGRTMPFGTDPARWAVAAAPAYEHPQRLHRIDTIEEAEAYAARISVIDSTVDYDDLGQVFARRVDDDGTAVYAGKSLIVPRVDYSDLWLGQYRRLSAWHYYAQELFPTAKKRSVQAAKMHQIAAAAAETALIFVQQVNRWVTAAYADSLTRDDVDVIVTDRPATAGLYPNPAGTPRLGY